MITARYTQILRKVIGLGKMGLYRVHGHGARHSDQPKTELIIGEGHENWRDKSSYVIKIIALEGAALATVIPHPR